MSNQIVITSGAKVRNLNGVLTGTAGVVDSVPLGGANGVATLDSSGKVPVSQLPASVVTYLGTWNASTNTPTLTNGVGDAGDMYLCNVAGTVDFGAGPISFNIGDWVLYGSGTWQKSNGQNGTVTSVDMTVPTGLAISGNPITTSGTLALSLASGYTIPTTSFLSGLVPYTGATSNVNLGSFGITGNDFNAQGLKTEYSTLFKHQSNYIITQAGYTAIGGSANGLYFNVNANGRIQEFSFDSTGDRVYTFPALSGTLALLENLQTFSGKKSFTNSLGTGFTYGIGFSKGFAPTGLLSSGVVNIYSEATSNNVVFQDNASKAKLIFDNSTQTYTFPASSGTVALTSNIPTVSGASGQVTYFNGTSSVTGSNNFFWDATNNRLGIGLTNPQRSLEIYSATADSHLRLSGSAPSVSLGEAITGSIYQAKFGLATAAGQYASGAVAGDFVIISQTGATIFATSATEKMRINTSGRLLLGTTTDNGSLLQVAGAATFSSSVSATSATLSDTVAITLTSSDSRILGGNSTGRLLLANSGTSTYGIFYGASHATAPNAISLATDNTERIRVTNTGNVGIGTSSPANKLHVYNTAVADAMLIESTQVFSTLAFKSSTNSSSATIGIDGAGNAAFENKLSSGAMTFVTAGSERMRITSVGNVGIGATGYASTRLLVRGSTSTSSSYTVNLENSGTFVTFAVRDDGFIETGTRSVSPYNNATSGRTMVVESGGGLGYTSSTRESKTNIEQLSDVSWLYQLNPVSFNYRKKDNEMNYTDEFNDEKWYGLIADEVESINDDLVFYNTKEDGTKQLAGVEYNKIIAALIKSSQEQQAQIEELKALIAAK